MSLSCILVNPNVPFRFLRNSLPTVCGFYDLWKIIQFFFLSYYSIVLNGCTIIKLLSWFGQFYYNKSLNYFLPIIELKGNEYVSIMHYNFLSITAIYVKMQRLMGPTWPQAEGFILGVGAKIFTVAGPVILYGTAAGAVYGVIYWIIKCITGG